jgi:hypothetical protein
MFEYNRTFPSNPFYFNGFREPNSYIRVFHASPDAPAVDVYANNNIIARGLSYRNFTEYFQVVPGNYNITVYPAGQLTNPVLVTNANIPSGTIHTAAAIGRLSDISLFLVPEPIIPIPPNKLFIRFVHLSPNAPNVDIALPNGNILFRNIGYKQITNYLSVDPNTYTIEVRPTGTNTTVLYVPNITLYPNRFYTFYAIGLANDSPPLQVLIPLDGNSYIKL